MCNRPLPTGSIISSKNYIEHQDTLLLSVATWRTSDHQLTLARYSSPRWRCSVNDHGGDVAGISNYLDVNITEWTELWISTTLQRAFTLLLLLTHHWRHHYPHESCTSLQQLKYRHAADTDDCCIRCFIQNISTDMISVYFWCEIGIELWLLWLTLIQEQTATVKYITGTFQMWRLMVFYLEHWMSHIVTKHVQ